MSDDNSNSDQGSPHKRNWFEKLGQMFHGEPKNREDLVEMITEASERELIDQDTKDMIEGVLEVSELRVRDIMIPRSQMVTVEKSQPISSFLPLIIESTHSRFPVVNEDKDHIEGILLAKDLLQHGITLSDDEFCIEQILRPAVVVPESKRLDKLLKEFRQERYHMAIVVDEFGGVSGLVTIEDILELIVGDIEDEFDAEESDEIRQITSRVYAVAALTDIDDFNDFFNTNFSDEEADTVGGLVMHAFGHLPTKGEQLEIDGFIFKVAHADRRRLLQLQVKLPDTQDSSSSDNQ